MTRLFLLSLLLFQCSKHGGPSADFNPVNFAEGRVIHSGFLRASISSSSPVSSIFVAYDGGPLSEVLWIQNPLIIQLPIWKTASKHTITIRGYSIQGEMMLDQTFTLYRGLNTDATGDGYSDVLVGAQNSDVAGTNRGIAYYYSGSVDGLPLTATQTLSYPGSTNGALFGGAVSMAGDVNGDSFADAIIAAGVEDKVYIFHGSPAGLSTTPNLTISYPEGDAMAYFGYSVASAGDINADGYDDIIIGALQSNYTCSDCGAAYLYTGSSSGLNSTAHRRLTYPGSDGGLAFFGNSVAGAGDVNGDGYADVIVGAPLDDGGGSDRGAAYIYHGSSSGIANTVARTLTHPSTDDSAAFGWSVSLSGDYNKDGFTDVVIGANAADQVLAQADDKGLVYIYSGAASGIPATVSTTLTYQGTEAASFGSRVSDAGDVNGDGYVDLAVAAEAANLDPTASGGVIVYYGSTTGITTTSPTTLRYTGTDTYAEMGSSIAGAGDTNGDGFSDLAVGVESSNISGTDRGYAYVFTGSSIGLSQSARVNLTYAGSDNGAAFGVAIH